MRFSFSVGFLTLVCMMMTSCSWMIDGDALGAALEPGIVSGMELATAARGFRDAEGRWPTNTDELVDHAKLHPWEHDPNPFNYTVIAIAPSIDQSLEIKYAVEFEGLPEEWTIKVNATDLVPGR